MKLVAKENGESVDNDSPGFLGALAERVPPQLAGLIIVAAIAVWRGGLDGAATIIIVAMVTILTALFIYVEHAKSRAARRDALDATQEATTAKQQVTRMKQAIRWRRAVVRLPFEPDHGDRRADLLRRVSEIRDQAVLSLQERGQTIEREEVRANIFFPDYQRAQDADVCTLKMIGAIHVGMDGHPDLDVTFRPGQGATGVVFVREEPHVAMYSEHGEGEGWGEQYQLTDAHKRNLHPEIRWVCSFPLRIRDHKGRSRTAAVLNTRRPTSGDRSKHARRPVLNALAQVGRSHG